MKGRSAALAIGVLLVTWPARPDTAAAEDANERAWQETLAAGFAAGPAQAVAAALRDSPQDRPAVRIAGDWIAQDKLGTPDRLPGVIAAALEESGSAAAGLRKRRDALAAADVSAADPRWAELYLETCQARRRARLEPHREMLRRVVFTKHYDLGGSHYAYTEGQSDAQNERHFVPGAALCLLETDGSEAKVRTLLEDRTGVIRDPDASFDGRRILFSWKKSLERDDYHLYEMSVADGRVRQITSGLGFADYEGVYLPGGDVLFNSTRCVQTVDCWWTEVSNLFTCDADGRYLRQLSFDQVHTNYPTVTPDGRVIYTRWDYNDRGQIYPQALFQMNQDGTGQTELYGNNSWFPTTILHARAVPGTSKIVCIFTGHHSIQKGWLGILDPRRGRQENQGARLIAPVRDTPAVHVDAYGQSGDQFQYPYPLSEAAFLVAFRPDGTEHFGIYWMSIDGKRELLAGDENISCNQPVPLAPRPEPPVRPSLVDYRKSVGTIYLHDVFRGPGLAGVDRGKVRSLRVIALEFRAAGIGCNYNKGPAGGALASTPVSIEGAWDVKKVLGTAKIHEDGSACFVVPARTPLYFQVLDDQGRMIQSMRSWVSLQPGETASCVGCHEDKNAAPPPSRLSRASAAGPQPLREWRGPPQGFSFIREIQPILDRHCVRCHYLDEPPEYLLAGSPPGSRVRLDADSGDATAAGPRRPPRPAPTPDSRAPAGGAGQPAEVLPAFSLQGTQVLDAECQRKWSDSYKALAHRHVADWIDIQSAPPMLSPYHAGASQSRLIRILEDGSHYGVRLPQPEIDRFIVWIDLLVPYCGDYTEAMNEEQIPRYLHFLEKRRRWQAQEAENVAAFLRERK